MLKPSRAFIGIGILVLILSSLSAVKASQLRSVSFSFLSTPIAALNSVSQAILDLYYFRKNAKENRQFKTQDAQVRLSNIQTEEFRLENERLTGLLELRRSIPPLIHHAYFCRVILRPAYAWNRVMLVDKGTRHGIKLNTLALSESSVIGKVVESRASNSKVLLITDPKSRIGAVIQRTRQSGLLFGTTSGECHMKYISIDTEVKPGDLVETAGFGSFFPKGLPIGTVERVWKEPGQIYQVASIKPLVNLSRVEEIVIID